MGRRRVRCRVAELAIDLWFRCRVKNIN
jgi:hypothetical protein